MIIDSHVHILPAAMRDGRERLAALGLSGRANVALQDYRETTGSFDRVVSIEMLEAVGEAFNNVYGLAINA